MRRRICLLALLAAAAVPVLPLPPAAAQHGVAIEVAPTAQLLHGGQVVRLRGTASCPNHREVLEAFVYVVQGDLQSSFGPVFLTCNGRTQRWTVRVQAPEGERFHRGQAVANPFLLVVNPATDETETAGAGEPVTLQ